MAAVIASAGGTLLADYAMRERINSLIESAVAARLPWRAELVRYIADVVHRLDEHVLVQCY
jgi:uncharacterized membrane-anchored protein YjiN (DUF445 family)